VSRRRSAVEAAEERGGCFRLRAEVDHGAWRHRRNILVRPGRCLQVTDVVAALDGRDHELSGSQIIRLASAQKRPSRGWRSEQQMEFARRPFGDGD
jgi:hypothetical protein